MLAIIYKFIIREEIYVNVHSIVTCTAGHKVILQDTNNNMQQILCLKHHRLLLK